MVESSLLESMLDLQFELISANLFDPSVVVNRGAGNSAHAFLPAPYGLYPTKNGYLAIAMTPIPALGKLLGVDLDKYEDPKSWWSDQEAIMKALSTKIATQDTDHWLSILDAADIWCAPVLTLPELVAHEGFSAIDMVQKTERTGKDGSKITIPTTRSPMRIDGRTVKHSKGAPHVGEDTEKIRKEFGI
jgi:crotonobetainyl-CoA:carnitine CoA-transferase CaiB-like acyl-CoA transferase